MPFRRAFRADFNESSLHRNLWVVYVLTLIPAREDRPIPSTSLFEERIVRACLLWNSKKYQRYNACVIYNHKSFSPHPYPTRKNRFDKNVQTFYNEMPPHSSITLQSSTPISLIKPPRFIRLLALSFRPTFTPFFVFLIFRPTDPSPSERRNS